MIAGLRSGAVGRVGWAGRALMMEGRVLIMYTYECWGSSAGPRVLAQHALSMCV